MASISGITAMLSLRGKIPVSTIVARGALRRQRSTMAFRPLVTSATLSAIVPDAAGTLPTLLVPARITITLGSTPSSSPCCSRQRMCCVLSAPQPKSPAFQPENVAFQWARKSG